MTEITCYMEKCIKPSFASKDIYSIFPIFVRNNIKTNKMKLFCLIYWNGTLNCSIDDAVTFLAIHELTVLFDNKKFTVINLIILRNISKPIKLTVGCNFSTARRKYNNLTFLHYNIASSTVQFRLA